MLTWWLIGKEPTLHKSSPIYPIKDLLQEDSTDNDQLPGAVDKLN